MFTIAASISSVILRKIVRNVLVSFPQMCTSNCWLWSNPIPAAIILYSSSLLYKRVKIAQQMHLLTRRFRTSLRRNNRHHNITNGRIHRRTWRPRRVCERIRRIRSEDFY